MATLYFDGRSGPVKVRDLSASGGLIEGAQLPVTGTPVRLCRGRLEIGGEVARSSAGRAGLKFSSAIAVSDWLPRGLSKNPQQLTDEAFQDAHRMRGVHLNRPESDIRSVRAKISVSELTELRMSLETLAEDLAADPHVILRHLTKLQTLDLVAQALTRIANEREL